MQHIDPCAARCQGRLRAQPKLAQQNAGAFSAEPPSHSQIDLAINSFPSTLIQSNPLKQGAFDFPVADSMSRLTDGSKSVRLESLSPNKIFESVCSTFRASLSEDEKKSFAAFADSRSMLESARQAFELHPLHRSLLGSCFEALGNLAVRLSPFFDVINIFIQSNPDIASLVWGSLRFMFQMGIHYSGFSGQVRAMFDQITSSLPSIEGYANILRHRRSPEAFPSQRD